MTAISARAGILIPLLLAILLPGQVLAARPGNCETCFSPEGNCDLKLIDYVNSAQHSIDLAIYDLNIPDLAQAIIQKAHSSKMKVRVVVDKRQIRGDRNSLVMELVNAGVQVRSGKQRGTGIMHNKFTIVDGVEVETGSFNYTIHASEYNHENQIYLTSPKVVKNYQEQFEKVWAGGVVVRGGN